MELGKQIRKYRSEFSMSQDELAERIYVSRQTISNWENDKTYPDVNSLVLLSEIFSTSLDNLIKGDVEIMKEMINEEERNNFKKAGNLLSVMDLVMIITPIPLIHFLGKWAGLAVWIPIAAVTIFMAVRVEKMKKKFNAQTWREIVALLEGTTLDEISRAREEGKRPYQKVIAVLAGAGIGLIACLVMGLLIRLLSR